MVPKKSAKGDLEKRRGFFFQIGIVTALALSLAGFEWSQFEKSSTDLGSLTVDVEEEEMTPITIQAPPPPPPPPPPKPEPIILDVKDNDAVIDEPPIDLDVDNDDDVDIFIDDNDDDDEIIAEPVIFTVVEQMPEFPGGNAELFKFLGQNIKYPAMAKDAGIQGIVYLTFVVQEDGSIEEVKSLRGIGGGCTDEALRVVQKMPKWNPGKQRGKAVKVQFNLPVRFILN